MFEILGYRDDPAGAIRRRSEEYLLAYQTGLEAFTCGDLMKAAACFSQSLSLHDRLPQCPASRLYLNTIAASSGEPRDLREWSGEIVLDSK